MISACSGASGSPLGGGITRTSSSSSSSMPIPLLALTRQACDGIDADDVLDLPGHALGLGLRQVHLVEDRQHFQPLLDGGVAVGDRLRLHALPGIDHQQRALAGRQRARDLVGEVHVPRCVDEVELVGLAVARLVVQRDALRLDGDAALALDVHRVEHLLLHLAPAQPAADLDETVRERRFAVIDVRDDGKIAYTVEGCHPRFTTFRSGVWRF